MVDDIEPTELTDDQKKIILNRINDQALDPPGLKELAVLVFGGEFDGRSKRSMLIKQYLASLKLKAKPAHEYRIKGIIELTEDQKQFIAINCSKHSGVELARIIFKNEKLTNFSQEGRSVIAYLETIEDKVKWSDIEGLDEGPYQPPKTMFKAISKIKKYVHSSGLTVEENLLPKQKKSINALIANLHCSRFLSQINAYNKIEDRELFESTFIRHTHDKSDDLLSEEVDLYIIFSTEVIIACTILKHIEKLQTMLNDIVDDDTESKKISMSLVEAISTARSEYNQTVNRQQKLLNDLKVKRSDRLSKQIQQFASLHNLVESWKNEEKRLQLLEFANRRKEKLKDECKRLETMDELKFQIFGVSINDILNS